MTFRQQMICVVLFLALLILGVFLPVVGFEFLSYDDGFNIYNNWRVTNFSLANLLHFWQGPYENLYIPLTYNLWAVLALLSDVFESGKGGGLDPRLFHTANLLLHMGCALAVLAILRRLVANVWAAWAGALLFAVHPVQVEAVAWVTGMKDVFSAFWSLLAIWQYLVYTGYSPFGGVQAGGPGTVIYGGAANSCRVPHLFRPGRRLGIHYGVAGLCFGLAILAKPGAVIVPLLILVIGRFWLRRDWRLLALEVAPLLLMAVPVILLTKSAQPDTSQAWRPELWERAVVAGDTLSYYFLKVLAPGTLGPDYGRTPRFVLEQEWVYLTFALPLVALMIRCRYRRVGACLAAADIFAVSLLPILGLVTFDFQNISTVADRYLYLAMLGPGLAIAWALSRWRTRQSWLVFAVAMVLLAGKAMVQVRHWQDSTTLTSHALTVNPGSWVMNNNLGLELAKAGRHEEAIAAFEKALEANLSYSEAYNNLGAVYRELLQNSDAIENFTKSLELNPNNAKAAFSLAMLYRAKKRSLQAIDYYRQAIAAQPDFLEAYNNLGLIYLELNRSQAAVDTYLQAIVACREHPLLHFNLARAYAELGNQVKSIAELRRATEVDPSFTPAYHQLYHVYMDLYDGATARIYRDKAEEWGFVTDSCQACRGGGGVH